MQEFYNYKDKKIYNVYGFVMHNDCLQAITYPIKINSVDVAEYVITSKNNGYTLVPAADLIPYVFNFPH